MLHTLRLDRGLSGQTTREPREHLWALWDAPDDAGVRHTGLALVYGPGERGTVTVGVADLDARWHEMAWEDGADEIVLRGDDVEHRELLTWMLLDLADAHVTPTSGNPEAADLAARLEARVPGALLDALAELEFRRHDGNPRMASALPARVTEPGQLIGWSEVVRGARRDDYVLADGTRLSAEVLFCSNPHCACRDLTLEFFIRHAPSSEPVYVGGVQTEYGGRSEPTFYGLPMYAERVRAAWHAFCDRYSDLRYFRDRHQEVKRWVEPLWQAQQRGRRVVPKASRNALCPCGSGQKYKKCCWARDAATEFEPLPQ